MLLIYSRYLYSRKPHIWIRMLYWIKSRIFPFEYWYSIFIFAVFWQVLASLACRWQAELPTISKTSRYHRVGRGRFIKTLSGNYIGGFIMCISSLRLISPCIPIDLATSLSQIPVLILQLPNSVQCTECRPQQEHALK